MHDLLHWLSDRYDYPPIYITENGVDVPGESQMSMEDALNDTFRVDFYSGYLENVMMAMEMGVNVKSYFAWSLMVS
jgi:beta-glucosidase